MTPAARVQAAIEILDIVQAGTPAEQALTRWARRSRFAGSSDRAAVRDHVFSTLRRLRSFAALGGEASGRGLLIGALRSQSQDLGAIFCDILYGPASLTDAEKEAGHIPTDDAERLDIPDWLWPLMQQALGEEAEVVATILQDRASVHLRVNLRKSDVATAISELQKDGIVCVPHPASPAALTVTDGNRRIRNSAAYTSGLVELQDAASQCVIEVLPLKDGMRVLDYCAGGGGKTLAMSARADLDMYVHDLAPERMRDLLPRAERAGVQVSEIITDDLTGAGTFDLVLCDVPCSGSGSWRRAPDAKWRLTSQQLQEFSVLQYEILTTAAKFTASNGVLVYVTCSILNEENEDSVNRFLADNPDWKCHFRKTWKVSDANDGFFTAHLTRVSSDM